MSDYLWDRSGEPDEEMQKLEELLAPLGYQPRPLQIPDSVVPERRRTLTPTLAIAATILLAALALGLWLTINRKQAVQPLQAVLLPAQNTAQQSPVPISSPEKPEVAAGPNKSLIPVGPRLPHRQMVSHRERSQPIERQATRETIASARAQVEANEAEGERAKEQLMTALRLVSTKLNHAQKQTQGDHFIRNQHKVG
ncbi:MAG: hypothetical protein QOD75_2353 [Blastocatellia bacterium]|jgi:hypothetical protein|nr:hypothetical protein [Blastocatellia bacterium]